MAFGIVLAAILSGARAANLNINPLCAPDIYPFPTEAAAHAQFLWPGQYQYPMPTYSPQPNTELQMAPQPQSPTESIGSVGSPSSVFSPKKKIAAWDRSMDAESCIASDVTCEDDTGTSMAFGIVDDEMYNINNFYAEPDCSILQCVDYSAAVPPPIAAVPAPLSKPALPDLNMEVIPELKAISLGDNGVPSTSRPDMNMMPNNDDDVMFYDAYNYMPFEIDEAAFMMPSNADANCYDLGRNVVERMMDEGILDSWNYDEFPLTSGGKRRGSELDLRILDTKRQKAEISNAGCALPTINSNGENLHQGIIEQIQGDGVPFKPGFHFPFAL